MEARLRQSVRQRAKNRCEYCGLHQDFEPLRFHIEHIVSRQHGGKDSLENLALACHHCNRHKGTNFSRLDPKTKKLSRLFHPRLDDWEEHFSTHDGEIAGLTAMGRTTVHLLRMNDDGRLQLRANAE